MALLESQLIDIDICLSIMGVLHEGPLPSSGSLGLQDGARLLQILSLSRI